MYEFDDDGPPRWRKTVTRVVLVLGLAAAGWFVVRPKLADRGATDPPRFDTAVTEPATTESVTTETATTEPPTTEPATTQAATTEPATTEPATTEPATIEPSTTEQATTTTTTTTTSTTTTLAPTTTDGSYVSLPDGSPVPVVVILDDERVGVSGAVPSQQAVDDLLALVAASNRFPNALFDDQLTVDPNVPVGVGVRFLELSSALFPEESEEILPDHARQLDRIVILMKTYPNLTAVIVGHADQRGSSEENLLLSRRRAEAIVAYLVDGGINGSRLSARAVGEADLISVNDDAASLALNRRSELIIYGLFVPGAPPPSSDTTTTVG
jgi:outer membrane protein OmpA-like peptidoglycan-associated protein